MAEIMFLTTLGITLVVTGIVYWNYRKMVDILEEQREKEARQAAELLLRIKRRLDEET